MSYYTAIAKRKICTFLRLFFSRLSSFVTTSGHKVQFNFRFPELQSLSPQFSAAAIFLGIFPQSSVECSSQHRATILVGTLFLVSSGVRVLHYQLPIKRLICYTNFIKFSCYLTLNVGSSLYYFIMTRSGGSEDLFEIFVCILNLVPPLNI